MLTKIKHYHIIKQLAGRDSMAVYLCENQDNGEQVVLKALLPIGEVSAHQKNAFLREISITSMLRHKNIVRFIDSGYSNGLIYCVTELCNGGNLRETMEKLGRPLTPAEAVPMACQILGGLDFAHTVNIPQHNKARDAVAGIVHRDIKPENILLHYDKDGCFTAKIADFGLSKAFKLADNYGWTRTGDIGGSLAFVCRQQIVNYKYARPEVDIWSAAAVLYFLLTGSPPRGQHSSNFNAILKEPPVPISQMIPDMDPRLANLIDSALDDSNSLLFKSAAELKTRLRDFL